MPAELSADPQVVPYLLYADAGAAVDWLVGTFGFTCRARHIRPDGTVRHAELVLDRGGVIMLGSPGDGYVPPARLGGATQLIRITVTDLPGHRHRTGAGADASAIEPGPPGWISYSVTDPEGHQWYFTEQVSPAQ
jgi:MerR family transcriptional regulator, thiopeptide resistance regulator